MGLTRDSYCQHNYDYPGRAHMMACCLLVRFSVSGGSRGFEVGEDAARRAALNHELVVINHELVVINHELVVINHELVVINHELVVKGRL